MTMAVARHRHHRLRHRRRHHRRRRSPAAARSIVILERGERLADDARDARRAGRSSSMGTSGRRRCGARPSGEAFNPGNYYYVGGNSKLYGAVLIRYRGEDFRAMRARSAASRRPGRSPMRRWSHGIGSAEQLFQRARRRWARTRPSRATPALPLRAGARRAARSPGLAGALKRPGVRPFVAAARRRHRRAGCGAPRRRGMPFPTPAPARSTPRRRRSPPRSQTRTSPWSPAPIVDAAGGGRRGGRIDAVEYRQGERRRAARRRRRPQPPARSIRRRCCCAPTGGLANRSDQVGRNFMNHNCAAMLAVDPRRRNNVRLPEDARHQRLLPDRRQGRPPLGNVQLLGKISGADPPGQRALRRRVRACHGSPPQPSTGT